MSSSAPRGLRREGAVVDLPELVAVAERLPMPVACTDAAGRGVYANERLLREFGVGLPRLQRWRWLSFLHPDDRRGAADAWRRALAGDPGGGAAASGGGGEGAHEGERGGFRREVRLRRHDGAYRWHLAEAVPLTGGPPLFGAATAEGRYLILLTDIHERKAAEEDARRGATRQAALADLGLLALEGQPLQLLAERAVQLTADTLGVELCKVLELQPGGAELLLTAGVGWQRGLVGRATVGTERASQAGYTLLSPEPVVVADLRSETRFSGPPLLHQHGVVSGISVTIHTPSGVYGVMGAHTRQPHPFTRDDTNFLQSVANILGEAVERQRGEANVRALFDNSQQAFVLLDREARVVAANPVARRYARLGGWSRLRVGGAFRELLPPEQHDDFHDCFQQALAGGSASNERRLRGADGAFRWFQLGYTPIHQERTVTGVAFSALDITHRKRSEALLREGEQRLRSIYQNAAVGVGQVALDGRFLDVNDRYCEILGYERDELVRMRFQDVTFPADVGMDLAQAKALVRGDIGQYRMDKRYLRKDGELVWVHLSVGMVRDEAGAAQYFVAVVEDITARKEAEAALQRLTADLEERVRRRTQRLLDEMAQRQRVQEELEHARQRLTERREQERVSLARELHDEVVQNLLALNMRLGADIGALQASGAGDAVLAALAGYRQEILAVTAMLRRTMRGLRPAALEELGLEAALREFVDDLRNRRPQLRVTLGFHGERDLPYGVALCVYRVAQEALRNVVRHAGARRVDVGFRLLEEAVELEVRDDGRGFTVPDPLSLLARDDNFGLIGLAEHVAALGGTLVIRSHPRDAAPPDPDADPDAVRTGDRDGNRDGDRDGDRAGGTVVSAWVPLARTAPERAGAGRPEAEAAE